MFDFRKSRDKQATRRRVRGPITIGFEQLEGRELLSTGLSLTIIPTESRPLVSMPRPQVASFDPTSERPVTVSLTPSRVPDRSGGFRTLGGRFRFRFD